MKPTIQLLSVSTVLLFASCAQPEKDPEYEAYKAKKEAEEQAAAAIEANNPSQPELPGNYSIPNNNGVTGTIDNAPYQQITPPNLPPINGAGTLQDPLANPGGFNSPVQSGNTISHTIVGGDTLWGLARQYNTSIGEIKAVNGMTSDTILKGQSILIPQ